MHHAIATCNCTQTMNWECGQRTASTVRIPHTTKTKTNKTNYTSLQLAYIQPKEWGEPAENINLFRTCGRHAQGKKPLIKTFSGKFRGKKTNNNHAPKCNTST